MPVVRARGLHRRPLVSGVLDAAGASGVSSGYGDAARRYRRAGWKGVLYLPPREKSPPPAGFTGDSPPDMVYCGERLTLQLPRLRS